MHRQRSQTDLTQIMNGDSVDDDTEARSPPQYPARETACERLLMIGLWFLRHAMLLSILVGLTPGVLHSLNSRVPRAVNPGSRPRTEC
jgi:hypothetical protein